MRIVTWNMGQSHDLATNQGAWELLRSLEPDIALVQEAVIPKDVETEFDSVHWTKAWDGKAWGSGILSRVGALTTEWEDHSRGAAIVASGDIWGAGKVSIASLHARVIDGRVIPALRLTFDAIREVLANHFIVGGDFNTARAAASAWPRNGHGEFWADLEGWGFHEPMPLNGGERQSYWREWQRNKPPTIGNSLQDDHVLLDPETLARGARCRVWDTREVRELSDHGPVVVDVSEM